MLNITVESNETKSRRNKRKMRQERHFVVKIKNGKRLEKFTNKKKWRHNLKDNLRGDIVILQTTLHTLI